MVVTFDPRIFMCNISQNSHQLSVASLTALTQSIKWMETLILAFSGSISE